MTEISESTSLKTSVFQYIYNSLVYFTAIHQISWHKIFFVCSSLESKPVLKASERVIWLSSNPPNKTEMIATYLKTNLDVNP